MNIRIGLLTLGMTGLLMTGWAQLPEAQDTPDSLETKGSMATEWELEESMIQAQLRQMGQDYTFPNPKPDPYDTLLLPERRFAADEVPRYSSREISQKLYDIPAVISLDYNQYVQRFIDLYTVRRREQVSRMLGLAEVYFPLFEQELDRMGLPMELKHLPIVESALNPHARSRVGATGMWQFMLRTARFYGLKVDSYVDERCDPYKSTEAALRYLSKSYDEFGDWLLAIASYNCGPGNVRKAIRRSGNQYDFWKIREYLPRETRGYVPAFIAATYTFHYAADHNIFPVYPEFSLYDTDTLHLKRMDITLAELGQELNTDLEILRNLNPELKLDRVPYSGTPYILRVPADAAVTYAAKERQIRATFGERRDQLPPEVAARYAEEGRPVTPAQGTVADDSPPPGTILVYYTVRPGDVVGTIAEKYGVSSRSIANWNNLRRYRINSGQKLKIYTTQANAERAGARQATASTPALTQPVPVANGRAVYHKVERGDTLWGIARQYPDVSLNQIQALNPGLDASDLKVGQNIRVK